MASIDSDTRADVGIAALMRAGAEAERVLTEFAQSLRARDDVEEVVIEAGWFGAPEGDYPGLAAGFGWFIEAEFRDAKHISWELDLSWTDEWSVESRTLVPDRDGPKVVAERAAIRGRAPGKAASALIQAAQWIRDHGSQNAALRAT